MASTALVLPRRRARCVLPSAASAEDIKKGMMAACGTVDDMYPAEGTVMTRESTKHRLTIGRHLSVAPAEARSAPSTHRLSARGSAHRALIRLAVAASLLALVWVSLTSHRNFWEFVRATDQIYHANRVLRAAQHLVNLEQEAEIGVRGFHITGQDRYLAPYRRAQRDMPAALDMLRELTAQDAAQRGRFETLEPLLNVRMEMREREIGARRAGGIDLAEIALLTKEDRYKVDRVRMLLTEIQRAAENTLTEGHTAALQNEQRSLYLFIIANLLVLAVIAYLLVSRERAIREREARGAAGERTKIWADGGDYWRMALGARRRGAFHLQ